MVLVEGLYAIDVNLGFRLLTAARWESPAPIEEAAFGFRSARTESLGFPSRDRAMGLFSSPPSEPPELTLPKTPAQATLPPSTRPPSARRRSWVWPWSASRTPGTWGSSKNRCAA